MDSSSYPLVQVGVYDVCVADTRRVKQMKYANVIIIYLLPAYSVDNSWMWDNSSPGIFSGFLKNKY